jgi:glycosyltransferase involved in cell wall biosynthesis
VLAQTYTNWECIIVDDGSSDNTDEVVGAYVEKDSRFKYFHRPNEHLAGGNGARNYGFKMSSGEYIQWFDSDDLMYSEKIECHINLFNSFEDSMTLSESRIFINDPKNHQNFKTKQNYSQRPLDDLICGKIKFLTPSVVIRKKFLICHELTFDENLKAAQEWEFFVRLLAMNPQAKFTKQPLTFIRKHNDTISTGSDTSVKYMHYTLARIKIYQFLGYDNLSKEVKFFLRNYFIKMFFRQTTLKNESAVLYLIEKAFADFFTPMERFKSRVYLWSKINFNKGSFIKKYIFTN